MARYINGQHFLARKSSFLHQLSTMNIHFILLLILSLLTFATNAFVLSALDTATIVFGFSATAFRPFLTLVHGLSLFTWIKTSPNTDLMVLPCADLIMIPITGLVAWLTPEDILAKPLLDYCPPTTDLVVHSSTGLFLITSRRLLT